MAVIEMDSTNGFSRRAGCRLSARLRLRQLQRRRRLRLPLPSVLCRDPVDSPLHDEGPNSQADRQVGSVPAARLLSLGLPNYGRLADFFRDAGKAVIDEGERLGIAREEAVHNILFAMCFNSFGGMRILFLSLVKWPGRAHPAASRWRCAPP